jgi:ribosomal protein S18 acetylase RimI-like enzyme
MSSRIVVRSPDMNDVSALARVHVATCRETYRGLMRNEVLDDPGFIERRERFWTAVLTDDRFHGSIVVAEQGDEMVGIALAGLSTGDDTIWTTQLYVLYTYSAVHGSGAGSALLAAVLDARGSSVLWVADPNPRAQAFYRKHHFVPDGTRKIDDGVRELRMVRSSGVPGAAR